MTKRSFYPVYASNHHRSTSKIKEMLLSWQHLKGRCLLQCTFSREKTEIDYYIIWNSALTPSLLRHLTTKHQIISQRFTKNCKKLQQQQKKQQIVKTHTDEQIIYKAIKNSHDLNRMCLHAKFHLVNIRINASHARRLICVQ